ncbi:MAG: inositol monophosphatase [bacterium]
MDIEKIKKETLKAIKSAVKIIAEAGENLKITDKEGVGNVVTSADEGSEKAIMEILRKAFPACEFIAEETVSKITKDNFQEIELLFVVDPIDGTTNFVNGIPMSAISIGVYSFGRPIYGIVYDLSRKDIYDVEPGNGVFLNGEKIERRTVSSLARAVVGSSWAYGNTPQELVEKWAQIVGKVATMRCMGSAVMDLIMTARGQFGVYVHNLLKPYDCAAGLMMLKELGVKATDWEGKESTIFDEKIIAAPVELYEEFYNLLFK